MTSFQQQTVLVVDDEPFSQGLVVQMLRRAGAGEVLTAANGYEALDIIERHQVTVVVIDFRMPGIHGLEVLKRIRTGRTAAPRNLICVMLTGHAVRHLVGLAIVLDVDTFLAKPVSLETLIKHLNRSLQYRFEPLPVEDYEAVDVAHADAFLNAGVPAPPAVPPQEAPTPEEDPVTAPARPSASADPAPAAARPPRPEKALEGKTAAAAKKVPEAKKAARRGAAPDKPAVPRAPGGPATAVKLADVPEGAVVARNVVGRSGTLLLAAGTPFRVRYARRLQELSDIEGEIKEIWIHA